MDGLEKQLKGKAVVARVDAFSDSGGTLSERYQVASTPTYLLLAPNGDVLYRQVGGSPHSDEILDALARLKK